MRTVKRIMFAQDLDMGGTPVKQSLPTNQIEQIDPFLLLHHLHYNFEGGSQQKIEGIGPHPHRGFSPVTFIFKGDVHHRDSRGNSAVIHDGGVQWMDAGMGIVHSERPSKQLAEKGGEQEIIQVWINTPQISKMDQPRYQPFQYDELPHLPSDQGEGKLTLVAGTLNQVTGPVKSNTNILAVMGSFKAEASSSFNIPDNMNALIYLLDGEVKIDGYGLIEGLNLIYFNREKGNIKLTAKKDVRFLLLAGEPINEPLAQQGPFVMNNETEILKAMRDYQMGKMGILIEEFD